MKFFAIFLEFSITRWVGTKRNNIFYFLYFSTISNLFWLEMKPQWYFLIFLNFVIFFWNFLLPVWSEGNGNKIFIFLFLGRSQLILAWNEATIVFFDFFEFSSLFLEFSVTNPIGRKRKDNFYVFSFSAFSNLFWHEMKPQWYFFIFFSFFGILYFPSGRNGTERQFLFYLFLLLVQPILAWKEAIMGFFFFCHNFFTFFFLIISYASGRNETKR